ncbi:MAG: hypothetical protein ACYTG5_16390, partial [Planctomycetota bacterium]
MRFINPRLLATLALPILLSSCLYSVWSASERLDPSPDLSTGKAVPERAVSYRFVPGSAIVFYSAAIMADDAGPIPVDLNWATEDILRTTDAFDVVMQGEAGDVHLVLEPRFQFNGSQILAFIHRFLLTVTPYRSTVTLGLKIEAQVRGGAKETVELEENFVLWSWLPVGAIAWPFIENVYTTKLESYKRLLSHGLLEL